MSSASSSVHEVAAVWPTKVIQILITFAVSLFKLCPFADCYWPERVIVIRSAAKENLDQFLKTMQGKLEFSKKAAPLDAGLISSHSFIGNVTVK